MPLSERELEDWVWSNLEKVIGRTAIPIARQLNLGPAGILDILACRVSPDGPRSGLVSFTVMELKAGIVGADAVSQVLRYIGALMPLVQIVQEQLPDYWTAKLGGLLLGPRMALDAALAVRATNHIVEFAKLEVGIPCLGTKDLGPRRHEIQHITHAVRDGAMPNILGHIAAAAISYSEPDDNPQPAEAK